MNADPRVQLPDDLPRPFDDGAAAGVEGRRLPSLDLPSTTGQTVNLAATANADRKVVVYVYPRTGAPGEPPPPGWMEIPGAFGCTAENCAFRDHAGQLVELRAGVVGLSAQPLEEQREFAARERMPYPLVNDSGLLLAEAPGLPTFETAGMRLYKRLTMVVRAGHIEKVFYPVFPPDSHAAEALGWLRDEQEASTP